MGISTFVSHSCLKWPFEDISNLISQHLTYSAIWVPNWKSWHTWAHFSTGIIETLWGGKEDSRLARNNCLWCLQTRELIEKGSSVNFFSILLIHISFGMAQICVIYFLVTLVLILSRFFFLLLLKLLKNPKNYDIL